MRSKTYFKKDRLQIALLVAILLSALALRIAGIHAPPTDGDEEPVVSHALALSWHDWNPHVFFYGSLTFYLFKMSSVLWSAINGMLGNSAPTIADFNVLFRAVSVVFGTATVFLAYVLGRLIGGKPVGLFTAGLMAFSPLATSLSCYATVDAVGGFWAAVAWVGMAVWITGRVKWASALAGLGVGAAMGTKYNAAVLLVPIFLLSLELNRSDSADSPTKLRRSAFTAVVIAALAMCGLVLASRAVLLATAARWTITGILQPSYVRLFDKMLLLACLAAVGGLVVAIGLALRWSYASRI